MVLATFISLYITLADIRTSEIKKNKLSVARIIYFFYFILFHVRCADGITSAWLGDCIRFPQHYGTVDLLYDGAHDRIFPYKKN